MLPCGERHRLVDGFGRTLARTIAKLRDTFFRYGKGRRCGLGLQDERRGFLRQMKVSSALGDATSVYVGYLAWCRRANRPGFR